jgi:WXG100 family type VII secretion target
LATWATSSLEAKPRPPRNRCLFISAIHRFPLNVRITYTARSADWRYTQKGQAMPYIEVTAEELSAVSTQLTSASEQIGQELSGLGGRVQGLPWKGQANAQFETLWTEWQTSWTQLQSALTGIAGLLGNAANVYTQAEGDIVSSMQQ